MTDKHLNRRSFLKRFVGTVGVLSTASVLAPRLPASADVSDNDVTATAQDMTAAERYTLVQWNGPSDATIQLRQLQLFGTWTTWDTASVWTDASTTVSSDIHRTGLIRTNGAQAIQVRVLTPGVENLTIVRIAGQKSPNPVTIN